MRSIQILQVLLVSLREVAQSFLGHQRHLLQFDISYGLYICILECSLVYCILLHNIYHPATLGQASSKRPVSLRHLAASIKCWWTGHSGSQRRGSHEGPGSSSCISGSIMKIWSANGNEQCKRAQKDWNAYDQHLPTPSHTLKQYHGRSRHSPAVLQPTTRTSTSSRHQQQHNPRVQTVSSSMNRFNHAHPCIAKGGEARDLHNLAQFHICSKNPSSMTTDYYAWPQFKKELNAHNPMEVLNPASIGYEAIQKNSVSTC